LLTLRNRLHRGHFHVSRETTSGSFGRHYGLRGFPAEHRELMLQHDQLNVFGDLAAPAPNEQPQNSGEREMSERKAHHTMLPKAAAGRSQTRNLDFETLHAERLKDTALVIEGHPVALQLRTCRTLLELGSSQTTTIVFPAPTDLITPFLNQER
jgi:hypothetical protein